MSSPIADLAAFLEARSLYAALGRDNTCCKCRENQGEEAHVVLGTWRRFDSFLCRDCAQTCRPMWEKWLDAGAVSELNGGQEGAIPDGIIERVFREGVLLEIDRPDEGVCCGCWKNQGEEVKVILHALGRQFWFYLCRECMEAFRLTYYKWVEDGTPIKE